MRCGALLLVGKNMFPDIMHWTRSGELMIVEVLGGMGTVATSWCNSFSVLEETLPIFLGAIAPTYAENWMILFGPFLLAVVLLWRGGLVGLMSYFVSRINTVTNKENLMAETVLQIENISKSFGALRAISNLSLTVKMGEIHALIGPNGAGKTTLIQQVYGSSKPDRGTILLNGDEITNLTVSKRAQRNWSFVSKISNVLLDFTAFENAIIAELERLGQSFRFFQPAFADPVLKEGADLILDRVGLLPSKRSSCW